MKYPGRALLLFITISACLYGTKEVWDARGYSGWVNSHNFPEPTGFQRTDAEARRTGEQRAARELRDTMVGGF